MMGHNESAVRLASLAADLRAEAETLKNQEADVLETWLRIGAAMLEARKLHKGNVEFGQWLRSGNLPERIEGHEQAAAMWSAEFPEQFERARAAGKATTIRGIHAKWKELEAEEKAAQFALEQEARRKEAAEIAEAARIEARAKAEEEAAARKEAQEASDDQARADAEARAEQAAAAKVEAEQVAEAETVKAEPAPADDPYGYARLTDDALIETANGLRADLDEERAARKSAAQEIETLKIKVAELSNENAGATISKLQKQFEAAKFKRDEAMRETKRMEYRLKKAEARVKELQEMGIAI